MKNYKLKVLNHPNTTCAKPNDEEHCISDLQSPAITKDILNIFGTPDYRLTLSFNNYQVKNEQLFEDDNNWDAFISE